MLTLAHVAHSPCVQRHGEAHMFLHPCQVYLLRLPTFLHPQALWWEMKVQDDKKRRRDLVPRKEQEGILPAPMEYLRTEGGLDFPPFASSVLPPSPFLHSHHYFLSPSTHQHPTMPSWKRKSGSLTRLLHQPLAPSAISFFSCWAQSSRHRHHPARIQEFFSLSLLLFPT